ncbi:insulinase family protein [Marinospirillum celere]|nr:insulinase family protein [Marinospirillum celere]
MTSLPTPITSPLDTREYRSLELNNGLRVLLISDADAEKAAASMNVAAGSLQDPDEWPGLAHFLEHMLFLGTATYPESDAYQNYIRQHGGSYNAFTAPRDTNYFFDIRPEHLDGALSRFSRFFVDPLLSDDYLEREINAVHSEWSATLQDDGRLRLAALRQALNPEHPSSRFSAGNRDSLDIEDPALRQAMLAYHENYYHPDRMTLVIIGPQDLNELEALTEKHFLDLETKTSEPDPKWPELVRSEDLPALLEIKPLRQTRQLQLLFPIADSTADFKKKPDTYLAHLIGHEGQGSLLDALKQKGWVTELSAGSQMRTGQEALFSINLQLTPTGEEHLKEIEAAVFAWLNLIREEGIEEWRFQEKAKIAANSFRYQERSDPSNLATHLAMQMPLYPIEDLLRVHSAWDTFDAELIRDYLNQLKPDNRLTLHISPDVETDSVAPWLPAEYRLQQPLSENRARLVAPPEFLELRLPGPNPFIPSNLTLNDGEQQLQPQRIKETTGMEVWQGLDTSFEAPRAQLYISLQNPRVTSSLRERLLAQLTARWLQDELNAPGYPARLAGLNYDIHAHSRGLTLSLGGYNSEQERLLEMLLETLLTASVDEEHFQRLQLRQEEALINQRRDRLPQQLIRQTFNDSLSPSWTPEEQLKALPKLKAEDLADFVETFPNQLYVQLLSWGNHTPAAVERLADKLQQRLQPGLTPEDVERLGIKQLPPGQWSKKLNLEHNDRALLFYFQGKSGDPKEEAYLRLIAQLQSSAFFHELRTRQQLGYAVFSNFLPLIDQPGLFYFIQSPDTEPDELAEAIEAFLRSDLQRLEKLDKQDFEEHRQSLINRLTESDKRLSQRADGFWQEIGNGRYQFDYKDRVAKEVASIDREALTTFYTQLMNFSRAAYLVGSSPERRGRLLPGQEADPDSWPVRILETNNP